MKTIVYVLAAIVFLSLSSAHASFAGGLITAGSGYVGAGIGSAKVDIGDSGADRIDDTDTSFKIFGGMDINPNLAIEGGYINFGEVSAHYPLFDETDRFEGSALFLTGVGKVDLTKQLYVQGKIGLALWFVDFNADAVVGVPISASGDGNGFSPMFGLGAGFKVNDQLSVLVELERYLNVGDDVTVTIPGIGSAQIDGEDVDNIGAALIYKF